MAELASAFVQVVPSMKGVGAEISRGLAGADVSKGVHALGDNIIGLGGVVEGAGKNLSKRVTAPIVAAFTAASVIGMGFADSMTTIQARTGMADDALKKLDGSIREMTSSGRYGAHTSREVAAAYKYVAAYGQDAEHATKLMRASMVLATATGKDLGAATSFLADYLIKVGKDASYAEKYINIFTETTRRTNVPLDLLQDTLFRSNATLQATNITGAEASAMFGALYQVGIKNAQAYSGIENTMRSLLDPTEAQISALDRLNIARVDENGNLRDGMEFMNDVTGALSKMSGEQRAYYLNLFGSTAMGVQFLDGMIDIRDCLPEMTAYIKGAGDALDGTGVAFEMAAIESESWGNKIKQLRVIAENFAKNIFKHLAPSLETALEFFRDLADRVKELNPETVRAAVKIAAVAAAIGPLLIVVGKLIKGVGMLVKGIAFMMSPMGAVILLAGALVALFTQWDNMSSGLRTALIGLAGVLGTVTAAIATKAAAIAVSTVAANIEAAVTAKNTALIKGKTAAEKVGIKATFKKAGASLKNAAALAAENAAYAANAKATSLATFAKKAGTVAVVGKTVAKIAATVAKGAATVAQWALNVAMYANPIGAIIAIVMAAVAAIAALVYGIVQLIRNWERVTETVRGWGVALGLVSDNTYEAAAATGTMGAAISDLTGRVHNHVQAQQNLENATDGVTSANQRLIDSIRGVDNAKLESSNAAIALERSMFRLSDAQEAYAEIAAKYPPESQKYREALLNKLEAQNQVTSASHRLIDAEGDLSAARRNSEVAAMDKNMALWREHEASRAATDATFELVAGNAELGNSASSTAGIISDACVAIAASYAGMCADSLASIVEMTGSSIEEAKVMYRALYGNSIIPKMTSGIISSFAEMESGSTGHASGMASTVMGRFSDLLSDSTSTFGTLRSNITSRLSDTLGNVTTSAGNIRDRLTSRFREGCTEASGSFRTMGTDVASRMASTLTDVTARATSISSNLTSRISEGATDVVARFRTMGTDSNSTLSGFVDNFGSVGRSLVGGLLSGIAARASEVTSRMRSLAQNALNAARSALDVRSPSREFAKIGQFICDGLIVGIDDGTADVLKSVAGLSSKVKSAFDITPAVHVGATLRGIGTYRNFEPAVATAGSGNTYNTFNTPVTGYHEVLAAQRIAQRQAARR